MSFTLTKGKIALERTLEVLVAAGVRQGFSASLHKVRALQYFILSGPGDVEHAYRTTDVDPLTVSASDWDYSAWRAGVTPESSVDVAVYHFMKNNRRVLAGGNGSAILSDEQRAVLKLLADGKPCFRPDLPDDQRVVLQVADQLGWSYE